MPHAVAVPIEEITEDMFARYEYVRQEGRFNMRTPQAGECACLSPGEHLGVIKNYTELNAKWPHVRENVREELSVA